MKIEDKTIVLIIVLVLTIFFILLILNPEPHFKITKEGVEINKIGRGKDCMIFKKFEYGLVEEKLSA